MKKKKSKWKAAGKFLVKYGKKANAALEKAEARGFERRTREVKKLKQQVAIAKERKKLNKLRESSGSSMKISNLGIFDSGISQKEKRKRYY